MPHSMVKFSPFDVTIVLFEAGHDTPVDEEPDAAVVVEAPALVVLPVGATQLVFW